jgi:2',3'-cyclic-nucleotide 2'-phosphodiesterase (5'-nucleotidase family)
MTQLTILHTNDLHGRLQQLERIAALAKRIRSEVQARGGFCVLWDAGDAEDTTLLESSMTKGSAVSALMRAAGYELATLGNTTPMRYGPQVIPGLAKRFGQTLLAANMFNAATGQLLDGLSPYTIQKFGDTAVGIIGLTTPGSVYSVFKDLCLGEPIAILPDLIAQVRGQGAQMVVLLSHLGFSDDQKVAEQVTGLDVIIGAHSHTEINPPLVVNGSIITQAGDYGRFLGRLVLEINAGGKIIQHHGELIPIGEDIPLDATVQAAYEVERESVRAMTLRVIGELNAPIDTASDRECVAGNLLADALLVRTPDAEMALVLAGHWRSGLPVGPVTLGALNTAIRSTANPARVELTGEQILHFLRESLKPENAARKPSNLRGVALGWPHVAGITVQYDPNAPDSLEVRLRDRLLNPNGNYVVAGTDLEFWDAPGYPGYLALPEHQIDLDVPTIIPEIMEDYLTQHSPLTAPTLGRIQVR